MPASLVWGKGFVDVRPSGNAPEGVVGVDGGTCAGAFPATPPCMTAARLVLPETTYLITRRCTQRQFLLRPSAETNQVFLYCLAVAAERAGIETHGAVQMSNHWHGVVTDPGARLPVFLQEFHRFTASVMNSTAGAHGEFLELR